MKNTQGSISGARIESVTGRLIQNDPRGIAATRVVLLPIMKPCWGDSFKLCWSVSGRSEKVRQTSAIASSSTNAGAPSLMTTFILRESLNRPLISSSESGSPRTL